MTPPSKQTIAELVGITLACRSLVDQLATRPGIPLSVYYTLFIGELVDVAQVEGNFEGVMKMLQRDAARWDAMLKAKNAQELYEIARFTADFVTDDEHHTKQ